MVTGVLAELNRHVNSRWFTAVLLPGLLLVTVGVAGRHLGHEGALSADELRVWAESVWHGWRREPSGAAVDVGLALLAAGVVGALASELGVAVERVWLNPRPSGGGRRRRRAVRAAERAGVETVAVYLPQRRTWMSDRVRLVEARTRAQYWFDASAAWPRLWLLLGDEARRPVISARAAFADAVSLAGWGCLYALVGIVWWPALVVGACVFLTGWRRARTALDDLATLIESAVDVHHRALAEALGVPLGTEGVGAAEGARIDDMLRKGGA
ncbi:hypothetical protein ACH4CD_26920 [Streptomyces fungicidicus]|uniref:hypothetical protein n=1 Tax=Streptomyces fungicidicus TaxID=68203 RepID=UPI0037B65998